MKILVFTSLYPNNVWPHHGVFVKERMTRFATLPGCEVKVVAPVPYFPPLKLNSRWQFSQVRRSETIEGLEVYHPRYFMIPKVGMALHGWLMYPSLLSTLRRIHRNFSFDLLDAHYAYPDGFAAVLLGRSLKKPVIVSARGSDINLFKEFPIIRRLLQYTLRKADRIIAVSQALKEMMVGLGISDEKIFVIPNGVDTEKFYPCPKEAVRAKLGLPAKQIILSVGNLTANKGFDLLIKALQVLREEQGEHTPFLVIAGEGEFRKQLEDLISSLGLTEYVRLLGAIPHSELHLWYSAADLFCLASGREGWPNVLLEALACGTPVLATAAGGIPEIICSDQVGLLTQRNEHDLAAGIARALRQPWCADTIVRQARTHTWDDAARSIRKVFESVVWESPLGQLQPLPEAGKSPSFVP